jgi:hypothetical protein
MGWFPLDRLRWMVPTKPRQVGRIARRILVYIQTKYPELLSHKVILKGNKDGVPHYLVDHSKYGKSWIAQHDATELSKEETIKLSLKGEL